MSARLGTPTVEQQDGPSAQQLGAGYDTSTRGAWAIVARREVMAKLADRTFLVSTAAMAALIIGIVVLQVFLAAQTTTYEVAATSDARSTTQAVVATARTAGKDPRIELIDVADAAAARATLTDERADAWLARSSDGWTLTTAKPEPELTALVQQVVRDEAVKANAAEAGTTLEQLQRGSVLRTTLVDGGSQDASVLSQVLGFAFAFLFYGAVIMFGMTLASSVVEEKQSRIVEIIAAAIPIRQLLIGKVVGNTSLAFGQMVAYVGIGLVGLSFTDYSTYLANANLSGSVVWFLVFFLAGFVALACLWAAAGALASRNEDLQSTTTPLTFLVMAILFGGMFLDGTVRTIASFVPPMSAVLMPQRLLDGTAAWWEPVVALSLLLGFAMLTMVIGERLYRRALLQTHGRVALRQAWSAVD